MAKRRSDSRQYGTHFTLTTYALETAKDMHWTYRLLSDREWAGRHAPALNPDVNGIYVSRTSLDAAFDDNGWQVSPLMARLTGRVKELETLFNRCGWQMTGEGQSGLYALTAEKHQLTETQIKSAQQLLSSADRNNGVY